MPAPFLPSCILAAFALAVAIVTGPATSQAADTTLTASFTVATSTALDPSGCLSDVPGTTDFGLVLPGMARVTPDDCRIRFEANAPASLHVYQLDGTGTAFVGQADPATPWTQLTSGVTKNLRAVTATPSGHLWASGYDGTLLASIDGGDTWTPQTNPATDNLRDLYAVDDNVVWGAGWFGNIIRTVDGGANWTQVGRKAPLNFGADWQDVRGGIRAIDENEAWVAGSGGDVFHTTDGGATWVRSNTGFVQVAWGSDFVAPASLWVVGGNGYLARSDDAGVSWSAQSLPAPLATTSLYRIDAWNSQVAYVTGDSGHVFRTTNGGATWVDVSVTSATSRFDGIRVFSPSHVVVVGDGGTIYETTDAGVTWQPRVSGTSKNLRALWGPDAVSMVAVGDTGTVVRSPVVGVADYDHGAGHDFSAGGDEFFGACLRAALGDAVVDMSTWTPNVTCAQADGGWWRAVPATSADAAGIIARTTTANSGMGADVRLRFGLRAKQSASPGTYRTRLVFAVTAP